VFELRVRRPDASEKVERFTDEDALFEPLRALDDQLASRAV
jgi:hypothetical protein